MLNNMITSETWDNWYAAVLNLAKIGVNVAIKVIARDD